MKTSRFYGYLGLCLTVGAAACSPAAESIATTKQTEPVNTGYSVVRNGIDNLFTLCIKETSQCGNATLVYGDQDKRSYFLTCSHLVDQSIDANRDTLDLELPFKLSQRAFNLSDEEAQQQSPISIPGGDGPVVLGFNHINRDHTTNFDVLSREVHLLLSERTREDEKGNPFIELYKTDYDFQKATLKGFELEQPVILASHRHLLDGKKSHKAGVIGTAQEGKTALLGFGASDAPNKAYSCGTFLPTPKPNAPPPSEIPVLGIYSHGFANAEDDNIGIGLADHP